MESRADGEVLWVFRHRMTDASGKRVQRKRVIGSLREYPTESAAQGAADLLRLEINHDKAPVTQERTFGMLIDHFTRHELADANEDRAWSTSNTYRSYLKNWIRPRWGLCPVKEVKTVAVEKWLRELALANGSKKKVRDIMSVLYTHGIRHEWLPMGHNPIAYVRQSGKRQRIPDILTIEELHNLWIESAPRERATISVAFGNGLRVSEAFALKIEDIDFEKRIAWVTKSIVKGHLGSTKTEASQRPVPLTDYQLRDISAWLELASFSSAGDWLFASPVTKGKRPYWNSEVLRHYVQPLAMKLGIKKAIGWHTFRRTFSSLLKANGEDVKVVQELMRHGTPVTTMKDYTQAIPKHLRRAQSRVVRMVMGDNKRNARAESKTSSVIVSKRAHRDEAATGATA
jgi:integrase